MFTTENHEELMQEILAVDNSLSTDQLEEIAEYLEVHDMQDDYFAISEIIIDGYEAFEVLQRQDYSLYVGIEDNEALGEFVVNEGLWGEVPENLIPYIDYEAIGRDGVYNSNGGFTDYGFLELY